MTAPTEDVDWTAVDRRGRQLDWLALPALPLLTLAIVVVDQRLEVFDGVAGWAFVTAVVLVMIVVLLVSRSPQRRRRTAEAHRVQYAVRRHVDPGPELRERADRQARTYARSPWLGAVYPLLAATYAVNGRWDHPVRTAVALVVVAGFFLGLSWWWTTQARAARRWLADPPGPTRALPVPARWERWLGRRWLGVATVGCLALGLAIGLLAALLDR
jgi:hypothetical protein